METGEDLKAARDVLQSVLKARKIIRMYPANNPVYVKTIEECFGKFTTFFYYQNTLILLIKQNDIFYNGESVYTSTEREDNLALFFFKDGVRELTFRKDLSSEEMEDFLKIISLDFERDVVDDDVVTLFWERDFQNIQYVVDETMLADIDDNYEETATMRAKEETNVEDNILRAYEDANSLDQTVKEASIVTLTDKDLQMLMLEIEKSSQERTNKLVHILFELLYLCEKREDFDESVNIFIGAVEYAFRHGEINVVTEVLARIKQLIDDPAIAEEIKTYLRRIITFAGSETMIKLLGDVLDGGQEVEDRSLDQFFRYLEKNAIMPLMKILGELESIHARKVVIDALILLGPKDIMALSKGLNDSRWYVVRNIIYILRKIADKRAVEHLVKTVRHSDIRVKKEVIRTLGELGGSSVFQTLRECLDDPDEQVRVTALKALSNIGSEAGKRTIIDRISSKEFKDRDFGEKKEYFESLARWKDSDVFHFLAERLKEKSFFSRASTDESRACAAYALGLLGNKDALALLEKCKADANKLVREYVTIAIKRLQHVQH
ncbi:MAG: HEAT repeat domain-containing protein [Thermodesulfovibrionales bacterium]